MDYTAQVTKAAGDRGVDIILQRDGKKIIVQCKAHAKPVGPHIVRDLYGALHDFNADSAVLASLGGFTSGVYEYVMGKPIELIQLADIIEMQKKAFGDPDANAEWADVKLPKKYTSWQQIMQESLDKQAEQARERLRAKGFLDEKGHLRTDGDDIP